MTVEVIEGRDGPTLRGPALELACDLAASSFSLRPAGGPSLEAPSLPRCHARALVGEPPAVVSTDSGFGRRYGVERITDERGPGTRLTLSARAGEGRPRLRLHATLYDGRPFAVLRLELENATAGPLPVHELTVLATSAGGHGLRMPSPPSRWSFYRQGWQSWTPALAFRARDREVLATPPVIAPEPLGGDRADSRGYFQADDLGVVKDLPSGASALAGFISGRDLLSQVRVDLPRRSLEALCLGDGAALAPGGSLSSELLLVDLSGPADAEALARYGDELAREMGARVGRDVSGWCSWYRYFWGVGEERVLAQVGFLSKHRRDLPLEYVQVDDGYQTGIGDWTSCNERFPHGMAWLAGRIREAGLKPAIWLAPFMVGDKSALYREHPDWLVRRDDGSPALAMHNWDQDCYALDCSNPQALAWVRDLFRQVVDWGYEYVKIDFIYAAAIGGRRHDPQVTRVQAYRRGVEAIRSALDERLPAGRQGFILGCGALMAPSVGLVDGMRIGPDVAPVWRIPTPQDAQAGVRRKERAPSSFPGTENALRNVLSRYWSHRRLWLNDPDCLLVRDESTALTLDEVRTLATAIALSGGMLLSSDDLTALPEDRLDILRATLPPLGESATAVDLFESAMPARFRLDVARPFESWTLLGVFNWDDRRRRLRATLPDGRYHVFDFWSGRYFGAASGEVDVGLTPPHGCRLLAIRRDMGRPQLLSTSFHFSQGAREVDGCSWEARSGRLTVSLRPVPKSRGEVLVVAPPEYRLVAGEACGRPAPARRRRDGVVVVPLEVQAGIQLRLNFETG